MPGPTLKVDDRKARALMRDVEKVGGDVRPALRRFHAYTRVRTDRTFRRLRRGGTYRGVRWDGFAPQYTRKGGRDGTGDTSTVPAEGGIAKVRGRGVVKGRLRPSRTRVDSTSAVMQDTKTLRARAAATMFTLAKTRIVFGTNLKYARRQQDLRRFLFFELPRDRREFMQLLQEYIDEQLDDAQRRSTR